MSDPAEQRFASAAFWEKAAIGWARGQEHMRQFGAPVSHWMIEAIDPQPGQRVLELACGLAETGLLAAELVTPGGSVVCTDQAEAMLEGAKARAAELGTKNVEFKPVNAEWIDFPVASFDAALCRWGYMLMADPLASLRETRRVLKPGGHLALAIWDQLEHNPWSGVPSGVLRELDWLGPPQSGVPGPFVLGDREQIEVLLQDAGFEDIELATLELEDFNPDFEYLWQSRLDHSGVFADAVAQMDAQELEEVRERVATALAPFRREDGAFAIPGRTHVACASA